MGIIKWLEDCECGRLTTRNRFCAIFSLNCGLFPKSKQIRLEIL